MEQEVILGRKATPEEQAKIDVANEALASVGLEIYAIGTPRGKKS